MRTYRIFGDGKLTLKLTGGRVVSGALHCLLIIMGSIGIWKPYLKPVAMFLGG